MRNNVWFRPVLTRSIFDDSRVGEENLVGGNSGSTSLGCLATVSAVCERITAESRNEPNGQAARGCRVIGELREEAFSDCAVADEGGRLRQCASLPSPPCPHASGASPGCISACCSS